MFISSVYVHCFLSRRFGRKISRIDLLFSIGNSTVSVNLSKLLIDKLVRNVSNCNFHGRITVEIFPFHGMAEIRVDVANLRKAYMTSWRLSFDYRLKL